jgi:hypothetical protein
MANFNAPYGLNPFGVQLNGTPSFGLEKGTFVSTNTQACGRGDGLQQLTTGYLSAVAAAGVVQSLWRGIFIGCEYFSTAANRRVVSQYWPGGGNLGDIDVLYVPLLNYPSPRIVAQAAGSGIFTRAMIGGNMEIAYTAPSASVRGGSSLVAVTATAATTATLPLRLVDLWSSVARPGTPGTDDTSANNWGIFEFNAAGLLGLA